MEIDISIQYRCGDILKYPTPQYGFLPYSTYDRLLGSGRKNRTITLETAPMKLHARTGDVEFIDQCGMLLTDLQDYLVNNLGHKVVIADGSDKSLS